MKKYFFTISSIAISNNYKMAASLFSSSDLQRCAGTTGTKQDLYEQKCSQKIKKNVFLILKNQKFIT